MVRRYDDVVEVRAGAAQEAGAAQPPEAFLWRGRVYRVRVVLGHWHERRAWWTEQAARAVHGDQGGSGATGLPPGADHEVWRVEASAGQFAAAGVYDLSRGAGPERPWRLLRVAD